MSALEFEYQPSPEIRHLPLHDLGEMQQRIIGLTDIVNGPVLFPGLRGSVVTALEEEISELEKTIQQGSLLRITVPRHYTEKQGHGRYTPLIDEYCQVQDEAAYYLTIPVSKITAADARTAPRSQGSGYAPELSLRVATESDLPITKYDTDTFKVVEQNMPGHWYQFVLADIDLNLLTQVK